MDRSRFINCHYEPAAAGEESAVRRTAREQIPRSPRVLWSLISWFATMALIGLGWIFFRGDSLSQAVQMLRAVLSPSSYFHHFLTSDLYVLIPVLAI
jgi:D-alanyl-lipoteichoic acid acyltransferase DltB (MBOAT superfamily)